MADLQQQQTTAAPAMGPGGVPEGSRTSEYYRTKNVPGRFDNPGTYNLGNPVFSGPGEAPLGTLCPKQDDWFQGYTTKPTQPMYRTSNSDYGSRAPSVHTMPVTFHAKSQQFSADLGKCGMFRNHSLNCATDKSVVPDH